MNIAIAISLLYVFLLLLRAGLALRYVRTLPEDPDKPLAPGTLTIVQPILGGDPLLESRLREALAELPGRPFLWLVDEDDAVGRRLAASLADERVRVELFPPCPEGHNPKVWKLRRIPELSTTPCFAVLDDDTVLTEEGASRLVAAAAESEVATGLPCYEDNGDLASGLLAQFVNNNAIPAYLGTASLRRPFTLNGMGYAMRLDSLGKIGGFDPILGELTDDLALATLVLGQGGRIAQETAVLRVRTGVRGWRHYRDLMHRWHVFTLLLIQQQGLGLRFVVAGLHGMPPLLLHALVLRTCTLILFHEPGEVPWAIPLLFGVLLFRATSLVLLQRRFYGRSLHRPFLSILSELLQPVHFLHALLRRTIRWRSRRYRVRSTRDFSAA